MKRATRWLVSLSAAPLLGGCGLFIGNRVDPLSRYQLAAGGAGGPAAVFKMNTETGALWYAWWDPAEARYRWRRIETEDLEKSEKKNP